MSSPESLKSPTIVRIVMKDFHSVSGSRRKRDPLMCVCAVQMKSPPPSAAAPEAPATSPRHHGHKTQPVQFYQQQQQQFESVPNDSQAYDLDRPSKPPRKLGPANSDGSGSEPSSLQQTDNLVEEMILSQVTDQPKVTHKVAQESMAAPTPPPPVERPQQVKTSAPFSGFDYDAAVTTLRDSNLSVSSLDSGTSSHTQHHFVVVAVDFGTTYSGYAFSYTRDQGSIQMMRKWDGGGDPDLNNHKTPTTLLLKPDGQFHSFGFHARQSYHSLSDKEAKKWLYFEKFKMTLHTNQHLSRETQIKAANGKSLSAMSVFAHALRYFKHHALQELSDQLGNVIENDDVRWVVTVPAIWKQPAKQFMRTAAYEAGMASPEHPDQLLIALEPEAASIYCRKLRLNQCLPEGGLGSRSCSSVGTLPQQLKSSRESSALLNENHHGSTLPAAFISDMFSNSFNQSNTSIDDSFNKGTRYIVVDCGGGTVDITVHEIQDKQGSLKELHKATGGPCGSLGVDFEFEKLLGKIFGDDFIEHFKYKLPSGYIDLMSTFEARKRSIHATQTAQPSKIALPFAFINSFRKWKGCTVDSAVKKFASPEVAYETSHGTLRVQHSMVQKLFKPVTSEIVKHIQSVLDNPIVPDIKYLFLVGGFAESQLLQAAVRQAFAKSPVKVIIPQGVSMAILRGAVLYGLDPTIISIRRSRLTYGIGILNKFIRGKHPVSKLIVRDNIEWCADVFDKYVLVDQSLGPGDCVTRSYTPAKDGQRQTVLHIYSSDKEDAKYITDPSVKRCGTVVLDLDAENSDQENITGHRREIHTKMVFGDTEFKVTAVDMRTGKTVRSEIDFLSSHT